MTKSSNLVTLLDVSSWIAALDELHQEAKGSFLTPGCSLGHDGGRVYLYEGRRACTGPRLRQRGAAFFLLSAPRPHTFVLSSTPTSRRVAQVKKKNAEDKAARVKAAKERDAYNIPAGLAESESRAGSEQSAASSSRTSARSAKVP